MSELRAFVLAEGRNREDVIARFAWTYGHRLWT